MPFSCCVWYFRRWLSSTRYQTTATFALGGRPLYVESPHRFPSDFRFVNLPAPVFHLLNSPAHTKGLHCSVCVDVCTFVCFLIWECYMCICVNVLLMQHVYFDASLLVAAAATMNCRVAGLMSVSGLLLCNRLSLFCSLENYWTYLSFISKLFRELKLLKVWLLPVFMYVTRLEMVSQHHMVREIPQPKGETREPERFSHNDNSGSLASVLIRDC